MPYISEETYYQRLEDTQFDEPIDEEEARQDREQEAFDERQLEQEVLEILAREAYEDRLDEMPDFTRSRKGNVGNRKNTDAENRARGEQIRAAGPVNPPLCGKRPIVLPAKLRKIVDSVTEKVIDEGGYIRYNLWILRSVALAYSRSIRLYRDSERAIKHKKSRKLLIPKVWTQFHVLRFVRKELSLGHYSRGWWTKEHMGELWFQADGDSNRWHDLLVLPPPSLVKKPKSLNGANGEATGKDDVDRIPRGRPNPALDAIIANAPPVVAYRPRRRPVNVAPVANVPPPAQVQAVVPPADAPLAPQAPAPPARARRPRVAPVQYPREIDVDGIRMWECMYNGVLSREPMLQECIVCEVQLTPLAGGRPDTMRFQFLCGDLRHKVCLGCAFRMARVASETHRNRERLTLYCPYCRAPSVHDRLEFGHIRFDPARIPEHMRLVPYTPDPPPREARPVRVRPPNQIPVVNPVDIMNGQAPPARQLIGPGIQDPLGFLPPGVERLPVEPGVPPVVPPPNPAVVQPVAQVQGPPVDPGVADPVPPAAPRGVQQGGGPPNGGVPLGNPPPPPPGPGEMGPDELVLYNRAFGSIYQVPIFYSDYMDEILWLVFKLLCVTTILLQFVMLLAQYLKVPPGTHWLTERESLLFLSYFSFYTLLVIFGIFWCARMLRARTVDETLRQDFNLYENPALSSTYLGRSLFFWVDYNVMSWFGFKRVKYVEVFREVAEEIYSQRIGSEDTVGLNRYMDADVARYLKPVAYHLRQAMGHRQYELVFDNTTVYAYQRVLMKRGREMTSSSNAKGKGIARQLFT
jgi:hypothetical protein